MTTLTNFLDQWAKDGIKHWYRDPLVKPNQTLGSFGETPIVKEPAWCPVCETREARKAFAPYCSQICKEAAERRELMDRR